MIRVLIVDDEPLARGKIRTLLAAHGDFEVAAESGDGRDALQKLRTLKPDAVFLDVEMPQLGGMEMLGQVGAGPRPYTIMTTAHDGYAIRAFELDAMDYLLKPFDATRFEATLGRLRAHFEKDLRAAGRIDLDLALKRLGSTPPMAVRTQPERVPVKIGRRVRFLDAKHMRCILADRDYVNIQMTTGEIIHTSDRISQMEEKLASLPFLRVHRSAIVNLEQVREVRSVGNCYDFLLSGEVSVTSGCTYKRDIHALLTSWKKTGDKRIS